MNAGPLGGGATRMPGVRQLVKNMTGLDAQGFLVDPDEVTLVADILLVTLLPICVSAAWLLTLI